MSKKFNDTRHAVEGEETPADSETLETARYFRCSTRDVAPLVRCVLIEPCIGHPAQMPRVNLFIIGINKAGSSWLYYFLGQHPDVFMSEVKELYYFSDKRPGPPDLAAYHAHFPFEEDYTYYGEATPMYYRDPAIAEAIHRYNPDAKVLTIVRDPIQRLLSQYRYHKQLGILDEHTSVEQALDGRDPMLVEDSHYENRLPAFADRFGPEQFKIVSLEAGRDAPEQTWTTLLRFLNLRSAPCPDPDSKPENPTGSAAFRRLYRLTARPLFAYAPSLYQWMLQSTLVRKIKLGLIRLLGTADPASLTDEQEARLREEFAPTYAYLQKHGFDVYASSD